MRCIIFPIDVRKCWNCRGWPSQCPLPLPLLPVVKTLPSHPLLRIGPDRNASYVVTDMDVRESKTSPLTAGPGSCVDEALVEVGNKPFLHTSHTVILVITTRRNGYRTKGRRRFHISHKAWTEQPLADFRQTHATTTRDIYKTRPRL